jgi:hypothetical protein
MPWTKKKGKLTEGGYMGGWDVAANIVNLVSRFPWFFAIFE